MAENTVEIKDLGIRYCKKEIDEFYCGWEKVVYYTKYHSTIVEDVEHPIPILQFKYRESQVLTLMKNHFINNFKRVSYDHDAVTGQDKMVFGYDLGENITEDEFKEAFNNYVVNSIDEIK